MKTETLILIAPFINEATPVGSRVTCDPAPTGTDDDTLVLVRSPLDENGVPLPNCDNPMWGLIEVLLANGWQLGGSNPDESLGDKRETGSCFNSWTKGEENLIVTADAEFYRLFTLATKVSKHLNLLDKPDRIVLFQALLYGNSATELAPLKVHKTPEQKQDWDVDELDDLL